MSRRGLYCKHLTIFMLWLISGLSEREFGLVCQMLAKIIRLFENHHRDFGSNCNCPIGPHIFLIKHTEYYPPETVSSMMEVPRDRLVISIQAYIRDLFPVKSTEISFWPGTARISS